MINNLKRIAIVGAGLSGLTAAKRLSEGDFTIEIFDKGNGVGGRMSVRRTEDSYAFDHGAQYFTARSEAFQRQVTGWEEAGVVAQWDARFKLISVNENDEVVSSIDATPAERYVGSPAMNQPLKELANELQPVNLSTQVTSIKLHKGFWHLTNQEGNPLGEFENVIVSAPAPQSAELLSVSPALSNAAKSVEVAPSWACMIALQEEEVNGIEWDAAWIRGLEHPPLLSWAARNHSKPNREVANGLSTWVLHGSPEWSRQHLSESSEVVAEKMFSAFQRLIGRSLGKPSHLVAHRWRYALPAAMEDLFLHDSERGLYACGDWCGGPRVEGAFLSGKACADHLLKNS